MTLKQMTEDSFLILLRCVEPSLHLFGRLRTVPFVKDRVSFIRQQPTDDQKIDALLNVLLEVPDNIEESVKNSFISALRSAGQEHVANIFHAEGDKIPMSDEHHHTLTVMKGQLCLFVDPENGLLHELVGTEVISSVNENDIRAMSGYNEKARKLIEVLSRKSEHAFNCFIDALDRTGQSHVTYMLTGEGNSRPLKVEHRRRLLTTKRHYLVSMIDSKSSSLITALMNGGVFSEYDQQRVTGVQPDINDNRNEIILNLIARKSQSDFFNFISALNDTGQTHVVVHLIGANVVAKIKTVYESGTDVGHIANVDADLLEYMRNMFQTNNEVVRRLNQLLLQNGVTVSGVKEGCIEITFACECVESLQHIRQLYNSGELEKMLSETFCFPFAYKGLKSLKLEISAKEFEQCADMFRRWVSMTPEHRKALLSSQEWFVDKMRVSDDLLDKMSLPGGLRRAIQQAKTHEQQVKTLTDIVSRRPDSAFDQLINALKATHQHEAASVVNGKSGDTAESNANELYETRHEHVRNKAGHDLETLLGLIKTAEAGCLNEGFWTTFNRLCVTAREVAASREKIQNPGKMICLQNTVLLITNCI